MPQLPGQTKFDIRNTLVRYLRFTIRKSPLQISPRFRLCSFSFTARQKRETSTMIALESYFATLKLNQGVSNFTLVQDRALRRTSTPPKQEKPKEIARKDALRTSATKFSMDECDEPLYCPTRQISSDISSQSISGDSIEALVCFDDSYRSTSSHHQGVLEKEVESRWSSSAFQKNHDYPIHLRASSGIRSQAWRSLVPPTSR